MGFLTIDHAGGRLPAAKGLGQGPFALHIYSRNAAPLALSLVDKHNTYKIEISLSTGEAGTREKNGEN